jgi:hypothetical protein
MIPARWHVGQITSMLSSARLDSYCLQQLQGMRYESATTMTFLIYEMDGVVSVHRIHSALVRVQTNSRYIMDPSVLHHVLGIPGVIAILVVRNAAFPAFWVIFLTRCPTPICCIVVEKNVNRNHTQ